MSCCTLPAAPSTSTSHTLLFTTTLSVKLNENISSIFFPLAHSSSSKFASAKHKSSFFLHPCFFSETMQVIRLSSPFAFLFRLKKQCSTSVQENNFSTCASCICSTASQAIDVGIKLFYSCLFQAPGCLEVCI